jgi:hypothetical protein
MTQHRALIDLFHKHGNKLTLGHLLSTPLGYKATSRFAELRKQGYVIFCEQDRKAPSNNLYTLVEPERDGQLRLIP